MIGDSGDLNTSNSYFEVFLNGTSLGYFDGSFNTDPLKTFRNADHPDMLRSLLLPVTGIVNSTNNIDVWVDEVVVSDGWKSAVMTDSPIYGQTLGAGKCVQLLDYYWVDDEIYFLNNVGVFNSGETAYIHLLDDTYSKFKTVSVTIP